MDCGCVTVLRGGVLCDRRLKPVEMFRELSSGDSSLFLLFVVPVNEEGLADWLSFPLFC